MELGDRIREIRERAGMNRVEFSKALRVSAAYITFVEKGMKGGRPVNVSDQFVVNVAYRFGVSLRWLNIGEGEMRATKRESLVSRTWMLRDKDVDCLLDVLRNIEAGKSCCLANAIGKNCQCEHHMSIASNS